MTEHLERTAPRRRVLIGANIRAHADDVAVACRIVNLTMFGALLRVSAFVVLPQAFLVEFRAETYAAEQRWRRGDLVGVRFTLTPEQLAVLSGAEIQQAVREERAENATLRRREARLLEKLASLGYTPEDEF